MSSETRDRECLPRRGIAMLPSSNLYHVAKSAIVTATSPAAFVEKSIAVCS
jgi:hypothetical protein